MFHKISTYDGADELLQTKIFEKALHVPKIKRKFISLFFHFIVCAREKLEMNIFYLEHLARVGSHTLLDFSISDKRGEVTL